MIIGSRCIIEELCEIRSVHALHVLLEIRCLFLVTSRSLPPLALASPSLVAYFLYLIVVAISSAFTQSASNDVVHEIAPSSFRL